MARWVCCAVLLAGCGATVTTPPRSSGDLVTPRRVAPAARPNLAAAMSDLVPYRTDGRTLVALRTLWETGQADPAAEEARYLAAAASLDLAAYATFRDDGETLAALAQLRRLPAPENRASLWTAIGTELRAVRGVYGTAARGLAEGVALLQRGPATESGRALMLDMLRRRAPAAHVASLFYVDRVRRAAQSLARDAGPSLDALAALAADPCTPACAGSPLSAAAPATRRAAAAVQTAWRLVEEAMASGAEDPFAALVRPLYAQARETLRRVALPEKGGARGALASRIVVEVGLEEVTMRLLPLVAVADGEIDTGAAAAGEQSRRTAPVPARWGAKVVPHDPYTRLAREARADADSLLGNSDGPAPPVAIVVDDELEAHVLARVILSLMSAGFEDLRLRHAEGEGFRETRLRPVAGNRIDEDATRGRARVEIFGPFDYEGAERTFQRHAGAGRPASAQLVLFALIASRALHRALDAVRVAWPDQEADILLVLPQQVP